MEFKDYYAVLGVDKTAADTDIKRAYRKLARAHHPDLHAGDKKAEARFKEINEANEVLGDPDKRRKYDELGANWRAYEQAGANGGASGGAADWARQPGQSGSGAYRTMTPEEMQEMFGTEDPFSDFFQTYFGGNVGGRTSRRAGRSTRPTRGHDLEHPVDLTLEEAFSGTSRRLVTADEGKERTIDVRIPAGVKDGARVRAAGEGGRAARGGTSGDLYLTVHLLPHARFERRGQDLHTYVDIPVTTAVLGGEVSVPTLAGSTLRLKVPAMTDHGRQFRLRGHGMPAVGRPNERGDLYATAHIRIPQTLSEDDRRHYEALKESDARKPGA